MPPPITSECGNCAKCKHRVYMREYYRRNAERVRAVSKQSRQRRRAKVIAYDRARTRGAPPRTRNWDKNHPEQLAELKKFWRQRNPEKVRAHGRVAYALSTGALVRQACETCGAANAHAHHDDYSKPLQVRWLCPLHHAEQHWREDVA